jgi:pyruvate/2-oxoglutarate/acetoin dehydrogenase E1 component
MPFDRLNLPIAGLGLNKIAERVEELGGRVWVAEEKIFSLKDPVIRVCSPDTPVSYSPPLEEAYVPEVKALLPAIKRLTDFT